MRLEECCADELTRKVLEKLGNDECVQWRDRDTEMTICTSKYEMLNGLLGLNDRMSGDGYASIEDYLTEMRYEYIDFNYGDIDDAEPFILDCGWCWHSFEMGDGSIISYSDIKCISEGKDHIFEFEFFPRHCSAYSDCIETDFNDCS